MEQQKQDAPTAGQSNPEVPEARNCVLKPGQKPPIFPTPLDKVCEGGCEIGPQKPKDRAEAARWIRQEAAQCGDPDPRCGTPTSATPLDDDVDGTAEETDDEDGRRRDAAISEEMGEPVKEPYCAHPCNGDERKYYQASRAYPATYSKGLPHDPQTGLVDADVYCKWTLTSIASCCARSRPATRRNSRRSGRSGSTACRRSRPIAAAARRRCRPAAPPINSTGGRRPAISGCSRTPNRG